MSGFTIIVDTREQTPYEFGELPVQSRALRTGDYSIKGYEGVIVVERKTHQDAYATIGSGRRRFTRELERMGDIRFPYIVIEASLKQFLKPPPFSKLEPRSAVNSIISWSLKYGIVPMFASDRDHANALTIRLFEKFWKHRDLLLPVKEKA